MKFKSLYRVFVIAFIALLTVSCNDTLDQVGFTIQPGQDRLKVEIDTLELQANTIRVDSIFSKTQYPVLGEYTDPIFGTIKSGYIGEFYFAEGTGFEEDASIDSVRVQLAYTTMMGDSLSPMGLSVYEVTKSLKGISVYSNVDPTEYADMSAPLGTQTFTGKNSTYRTETTTSGSSVTVYEINVKLPNALGEKFLTEYKKAGHGQLTDADNFRKFFPGLYFTTDFGKSTILSVSLTSLLVHYKYNDEDGSSAGKDTIRTSAMRLNITPEVTQINHIQNKNDQLLEPNSEYTYVKSPAGVITEVTFPFSQMNDKLKSQALNLANFTVYAIPDADEETMVKLSPPTYLLLVNKDSLNGFFENRKLIDNVTSFLSARFDASTYSYNFNNLSTMANHYNEAKKEEPFDLVYYLIPVDVTFATDTYGNTTTTPISIYNRTWPAAAKLDKREGNLKLDMIFSNF
ncbi:DUF4270 domain-containing protein [uncultured Proteiniphilum sp.]|uniref:DUF4270 domain-containing protein n=1 Tax=uncultured Proteiniphilum sp. TaxID=497637 RepID=UPI002615E86E|nr:DUF4270 domain-containing protein [uncultured Proteiniphilum sp.]